jgi:prepilin-type N-terminal cleavage/methylation domain-containing protein/prepilin-type processing-associated H-X9-DG protein
LSFNSGFKTGPGCEFATRPQLLNQVKGIREIFMRKAKAFTLVELLVVISIIALLLAILMPSLNKAREQGKKIVCGHGLKMLGTASLLYAAEWNGCTVPYVITNSRTEADDRYKLYGEYWFQNSSFRKYMAYDSKKNKVQSGLLDETLDKKFGCPSDARTEDEYFKNSQMQIKLSFAYNVTGLVIEGPGSWGYPAGEVGFKYNGVKQPSTKFFFMDGLNMGAHELAANYYTYWNHYRNKANLDYMCGPAYRHNEGMQISFFDAHVEYRKKEACFFIKRGYPDTRANHTMWMPDPVNFPYP